MLNSLQQGPPPPQPELQQFTPWAEKNQFAPEDLLGLARSSVDPEDKEIETILGTLLTQSLGQGHTLERFLELAREGMEDEEFGVSRRRFARMLAAAGQQEVLVEFLPSLDNSVEENDREAINLLARNYVALHQKEPKSGWLEKAWDATQVALAAGEIEEEQKAEALARAVELAPKLQEELGISWLRQSFTERPQRGMEILAHNWRSDVVRPLQQSPALQTAPQESRIAHDRNQRALGSGSRAGQRVERFPRSPRHHLAARGGIHLQKRHLHLSRSQFAARLLRQLFLLQLWSRQ